MKPSFRTFLAFVHRWTGLTIGIVVMMLALTGVVLAMRPQLDKVVYGDIKVGSTCANMAPFDQIIAAAKATHAGDVVNVRVELGSDISAIVRFDNDDYVFVDACTTRVLGVQNRYRGIFGVAEQLHKLVYHGNAVLDAKIDDTPVATIITGTTALALAVSLIFGGLYLWWPRRRSAWKAATRVNRELTGRAFAMNLHTTTGFYVSLVILTSALTGVAIAFEWPKHVLETLTGSSSVERNYHSKPGTSFDAKRLPLEQIWRTTLKALPKTGSALMFPGRKPEDAVMLYAVDKDAPQPEARNYIYLDAYSGDVLSLTPYAQMSRGMQLYYWGLAIHSGRVGGLFLDLILLTGALGALVLAYSGLESYLRKTFRKPVSLAPHLEAISVRVAKIRDETPGVKSFELVSETGAPLPSFAPGAHINVRIENGLVRQYSLCNGPNDTLSYMIAVKREQNSRGGSQAMHEKVQEGDVLVINPPRCNFPLIPDARHYLLIAAGIGVTPILSMARHLQAIGASWSMQYFTRSIEATAFHDCLSQPEFAQKVTFHYATESDRLHSYLHQLLHKRDDGEHLYMCGPRRFMALVEEAAAPNWPPEAIHVEHFSADPMALAGSQAPFEIKLAHSNRIFNVPSGVSIADVLHSNGVNIVTSCEQGVCGACLTGVLDGAPDHRDSFLSPAERKSGAKMMICVSRARSDCLVLDI